jgi:membrane fusion protein (multidrug efflux system)
VSQQELDDARSAQAAGRSRVEAAKAQVDKATLDLGYTRVTSPIDGLVGITQVKPGALVGRGESTLLTTVSQIDPILFRVAVTEADYLRIARRNPAGAKALPRVASIQLTLADGTVHPSAGRIHAVERAVNPTTGTLGVQLAFPNERLTLRPGQYGRVRALIDVRRDALLVPQRAVQELQNQYSVAVVNADNKVAFRTVAVGPRVDDLWVIEKGLAPDDRVVSAGLQAIGDGMLVRTKPMTPGGPSTPPGAGEPEAQPTTGTAQPSPGTR